MTIRELIRSALSYDPGQLRPGTATRCAIGFGFPMLATELDGHPAWGVLAALGALYAGMASFSGTYRSRVRVMTGTSVVMSLVTWLACEVGRLPYAVAPAVGVVAFILALYSTKSSGSNTIAIQGTGVLVVISGIPSTAANPLGNAALVLAGGLFQTALLLAIMPLRRWQPEREGVASAYGSLADYVAKLAGERAPLLPDSRPFQDAWDLLGASGVHHRYLDHMLKGAEALRASLVPLARDFGEPGTRVFAAWLVRHIREIASAIRQGAVPPEGKPPAAHQVRSASIILRVLAEIPQIPADEAEERPQPLPLGQRIAAVLAPPESLALRSVAVQHALRYALAVGVLAGISHRLGFTHGYWLPLTAALVLRPDYATTITRALGRILGTVGGVVLATAVTLFFHPSVATLQVLVVLSGWFACVLFLAGYSIFTTAVTAYVVFSVASTGIPETSAGIERVVATLAGAAVAIGVNLLWPIWQSKNVGEILSDALAAQVEFGREVERRICGDRSADLGELRKRARALRMEAERVVTASSIEPSWGRAHRPSSAAEVLADLDENAAEMLALNAETRHMKEREPLLASIREAIQRAEGLREGLGES